MIGISLADGNRLIFKYDDFSRLIEETDPLARTNHVQAPPWHHADYRDYISGRQRLASAMTTRAPHSRPIQHRTFLKQIQPTKPQTKLSPPPVGAKALACG